MSILLFCTLVPTLHTQRRRVSQTSVVRTLSNRIAYMHVLYFITYTNIIGGLISSACTSQMETIVRIQENIEMNKAPYAFGCSLELYVYVAEEEQKKF